MAAAARIVTVESEFLCLHVAMLVSWFRFLCSLIFRTCRFWLLRTLVSGNVALLCKRRRLFGRFPPPVVSLCLLYRRPCGSQQRQAIALARLRACGVVVYICCLTIRRAGLRHRGRWMMALSPSAFTFVRAPFSPLVDTRCTCAARARLQWLTPRGAPSFCVLAASELLACHCFRALRWW